MLSVRPGAAAVDGRTRGLHSARCMSCVTGTYVLLPSPHQRHDVSNGRVVIVCFARVTLVRRERFCDFDVCGDRHNRDSILQALFFVPEVRAAALREQARRRPRASRVILVGWLVGRFWSVDLDWLIGVLILFLNHRRTLC